MVSSSKKKRGKQRKAAKTAAAENSNHLEAGLNPNQLAVVCTPDGRKSYVHPKHHKLAALYVTRGDKHTTEAMAAVAGEDVPGTSQPNISLVQSGVLSTVLNFLGRCEHESFHKVIAEARGHVFTPNGALISNVGGDLESPLVWMNVLVRAAHIEPSCMLQIAENIGPLVRCMVNDTERLFFKSNKHWLDGIIRFVELVGYFILGMSSTIENPDKKVVDALLQHEGLLTPIVQWGFWGENRRPDIAKELNSIPSMSSTTAGVSNITWVVSLGNAIIQKLITYTSTIKDDNGGLTNEAKDRLRTIGSTPIVSKAYDPTCMVSYMAGLIRHIKIDGWDGADLSNLQFLINDSDCVDKGVITELIDLGFACVENTRGHYNIDEYVFPTLARLLSGLIYTGIVVSDSRAAFAIRTGLIETSLDILQQYVKHYQSSTISISKYILSTFNQINFISLHKKTAKAINHRRSSIEEKLVHLEQNMNITNNTEYKKLLDMARSILDISGSHCCRCNKSLSKTEVMQCNGCGRMTYCSRACQKEDWWSGHSLTCCKSYTNETAGQFQGRYLPKEVPSDQRAAAKLENFEKNLTMVQLKLFLDNSETILNQAEELNLPLYDCVVCFDVRICPPTVDVEDYRDEFHTHEERKGFEETRSKGNITCSYISYIFNGEYNENGGIPVLSLQRMFPHEWLTSKKK